jgi:hypothetical protein
MEWLFGAALAPLVVCGAMCLGGMAVAAIAHRRSGRTIRERSEIGTLAGEDRDEVSTPG